MVNLLQYSCLGNPMDRGAWRATVHRVTKSQTQLKPLSTTVLYFVRSGPVLSSVPQTHLISLPLAVLQRIGDAHFFFFGGGGSQDTLGLTSQLLTRWLVSEKAGLHGGRVQRGSLGRKKVRV